MKKQNNKNSLNLNKTELQIVISCLRYIESQRFMRGMIEFKNVQSETPINPLIKKIQTIYEHESGGPKNN